MRARLPKNFQSGTPAEELLPKMRFIDRVGLALYKCHLSHTNIQCGDVLDDIIEKVPHQSPGASATGLLAGEYGRNENYSNKGSGSYPRYSVNTCSSEECCNTYGQPAHDFMPKKRQTQTHNLVSELWLN